MKYIRFLRSFNGIKWIIWDYDGTLWRSDELGSKLKNEYASFLSSLLRKPITLDMFDKICSEHDSWGDCLAFYSGMNQISIIDKIESNIDKLIDVYADKNVLQFFKIYGYKFRHIILSNSKESDIREGLNKMDIYERMFDLIIGRDTYSKMKPDKELFQKVVEYTKSSMKSHLVIGDSYVHDINPALEMGMKAMHVSELDLFM